MSGSTRASCRYLADAPLVRCPREVSSVREACCPRLLCVACSSDVAWFAVPLRQNPAVQHVLGLAANISRGRNLTSLFIASRYEEQ